MNAFALPAFFERPVQRNAAAIRAMLAATERQSTEIRRKADALIDAVYAGNLNAPAMFVRPMKLSHRPYTVAQVLDDALIWVNGDEVTRLFAAVVHGKHTQTEAAREILSRAALKWAAQVVGDEA